MWILFPSKTTLYYTENNQLDNEDMSLDMLCGVVGNVLERCCGAIEAGPFVMVQGE
jgi:hypothetical protein